MMGVMFHWGGVGSHYKGHRSGFVPLKWITKSASWYNDDPLFSAKTGINLGHIFKFLKLA